MLIIDTYIKDYNTSQMVRKCFTKGDRRGKVTVACCNKCKNVKKKVNKKKKTKSSKLTKKKIFETK
jgi:hypothetical protein